MTNGATNAVTDGGTHCKHSNRTTLAIVVTVDATALIFAIGTVGATGRSGVPCKHSNRTALAIVFATDHFALIFAISTGGAGGRSGVHCKHSNRTAPTQSARKIRMLLRLTSWAGEAIVLANIAGAKKLLIRVEI
jgi:hypothetical protein|tara:strand:- start:63 stop:467 length:405 start_codon:yes stop_codon:yes gene_type:complete